MYELEKNLGTKKFVAQVLSRLKTTPNEADPGKYLDAFYFVGEITESDIERTDKPSLYKPCPQCKEEYPVVMSYKQTEDGPDYDEWMKQAFVICPKDGAYPLKTISRGCRF